MRDGEGPVSYGSAVIIVSEDGVVAAAADDQVVVVAAEKQIAAVCTINKIIAGIARCQITLLDYALRDLTRGDECGHLTVILAEDQIIARPSRKQIRSRTALDHILSGGSNRTDEIDSVTAQ